MQIVLFVWNWFIDLVSESKIEVGLRHRLGSGIWLEPINVSERKLPACKFLGARQLMSIARQFNKPVEVFSWSRDEDGTSDNAGWEKIGLTIFPVETNPEADRINQDILGRLGKFV